MNLTYTLDSQPAGTFLHSGSPSDPNTSYTPSVAVFQRTGLTASPHTLTVSVGPDSVFLLDKFVYTTQDEFDGPTTSGAFSPTPSASSPAGAVKGSPSQSGSQCVNSAFTSGSVVLLANHAYLPFVGSPVLALLCFGVRRSLDLTLIRSSFTSRARPWLVSSLTPPLPYTGQRYLATTRPLRTSRRLSFLPFDHRDARRNVSQSDSVTELHGREVPQRRYLRRCSRRLSWAAFGNCAFPRDLALSQASSCPSPRPRIP